MSHQTGRILPALLVLAIVAGAAGSRFAGTWDGKINDLPGVELTIRDDSGRVSGSIGFYFQSREKDGKWHLGEKMTVPLLSPKLDGNVLTFETIHYKKHGGSELGPNNKYRVDFLGENEARIRIIKDQPQEESGLKLTRRK